MSAAQKGPDAIIYEAIAKRIVAADKVNPWGHGSPIDHAAIAVEVLRELGWVNPAEQLTDADIQALLADTDEPRDSITFNTDDLGPATDIDGNPLADTDEGKSSGDKLAKTIWDASRADEGTISATGADKVAAAIREHLFITVAPLGIPLDRDAIREVWEESPMRDTESQLADWKAKTDAATKGPWRETYPNSRVIDSDEQIIVDSFNDGVGAGVIEHPDAEFIAMSRTAMPRLLAAVEAIRTLHGEMRYHNPDGSVTPACSVCDSQPYPCETLQALDAALRGSEPDERNER